MKTIQEEELIRLIKEWIKQGQQQTNSVSEDITDDTDLIASGILDSIGFIELMVHLEAVTEEKIDLSDVDPKEFTTIRGLCKSVMDQGDRVSRSLTR